jgi:hypothetical protein
MWLKVVASFLLCTFFETLFFYVVKCAFDKRSEPLISVHGNQCIECQYGIEFDGSEFIVTKTNDSHNLRGQSAIRKT